MSLVRFQLLVRKAAEICQEVRSPGANLVSVEKEDAEALNILRSRREQAIMFAVARGGSWRLVR